MRKGGTEGEEGRREGGSERGMQGAEGGRVGGTERGKEGRRMGTRAKPGKPASISYLYPLVKPTLDYASASCDLYTTT